MKISSGWSKGLKILTPDGMETRPTRERVRQAAINMLQPWIADARVLDIFAGSGAVGIELASRGATGVRFVEKSPVALKCLKENVAAAAARAQKQSVNLDPWSVESSDALLFLKGLEAKSFDLIWADPPYDLVPAFLDAAKVDVPRVLSTGGVFVLESGVGALESVSAWSKRVGLQLVKQREYGVTLISVWQNE